MKLRIAVLCGIFAVGALAADVTGKWSAEVQGRGGQSHEVTMSLKAEGTTLTGTVSGPQGDSEISDGAVNGEEISFNVTREFNGNSVKMHYTGTVSGDEIKFKVQREGGEGQAQGKGPGRGMEFTAHRSTT